MTSEATTPTYSIEVSGWDVEKRFFVERAELRWTQDGEKFVSLRSIVNDGSLLYLRPILSSGIVGPLLMAYQAELMDDDVSGNTKKFSVHLVPHRRSGSVYSPANRSLDSIGEFLRNEKQPA
jgi:hypothetical protein